MGSAVCLLTFSSHFQGYDNTESSVRKASVFCLVAIYSVIGEELKPHLAQLTGSKVQESCGSGVLVVQAILLAITSSKTSGFIVALGQVPY